MPEPSDPDPTRRFSDRARDYARFRPDYPPAAIDAIVAGLGAPSSLVAVDVGAGTGISSRLLADRGLRVHAIEPNAAMRGAALPNRSVTWHDGTAEHTGLESGSADLVLCAQAFHWFDVAAATAEFQRVLRPNGRLALMWNKRSRNDAFTVGYRAALAAADAEAPAERSDFDPETVTATGRFRDLRQVTTPHAQRLSLDGLLGRLLSTSTVPRSGLAHDALIARFRALHTAHADAAGEVRLVYDTQVFLWTARAAEANPPDSTWGSRP